MRRSGYENWIVPGVCELRRRRHRNAHGSRRSLSAGIGVERYAWIGRIIVQNVRVRLGPRQHVLKMNLARSIVALPDQTAIRVVTRSTGAVRIHRTPAQLIPSGERKAKTPRSTPHGRQTHHQRSASRPTPDDVHRTTARPRSAAGIRIDIGTPATDPLSNEDSEALDVPAPPPVPAGTGSGTTPGSFLMGSE